MSIIWNFLWYLLCCLLRVCFEIFLQTFGKCNGNINSLTEHNWLSSWYFYFAEYVIGLLKKNYYIMTALDKGYEIRFWHLFKMCISCCTFILNCFWKIECIDLVFSKCNVKLSIWKMHDIQIRHVDFIFSNKTCIVCVCKCTNMIQLPHAIDVSLFIQLH